MCRMLGRVGRYLNSDIKETNAHSTPRHIKTIFHPDDSPESREEQGTYFDIFPVEKTIGRLS